MCYVIPLVGAIIVSALWRRTKKQHLWWLNLLFWGGAVFGVIDHLWNGELFVVSDNVVSDLMLGVMITLSILAIWLVFAIARGKDMKEIPSTGNQIRSAG